MYTNRKCLSIVSIVTILFLCISVEGKDHKFYKKRLEIVGPRIEVKSIFLKSLISNKKVAIGTGINNVLDVIRSPDHIANEYWMKSNPNANKYVYHNNTFFFANKQLLAWEVNDKSVRLENEFGNETQVGAKLDNIPENNIADKPNGFQYFFGLKVIKKGIPKNFFKVEDGYVLVFLLKNGSQLLDGKGIFKFDVKGELTSIKFNL